MTIDELLAQLSSLSNKLVSAPDDESKFDLKILVLQLQKEILAEGFQPLAGLPALNTADTEQLLQLSAQVDQAITDEQARDKLVGQIIALAKAALLAAGVKMP